MEVEDLKATAWFGALLTQVQEEVDRIADRRPDRTKALNQEWQDLEVRKHGWSQSLAKPDLNSALRAEVESEYGAALSRQRDIERQMTEDEANRRQVAQMVVPAQVVERLNRLAEVLASGDPTRGNLELSLHIDSINCFQDGAVIVRSCKLGALAATKDLFIEPAPQLESSSSEIENGTPQARPRRRARLRVTDDGHGQDLKAAAHVAADVHRFGGLGPHWFWEDAFQIPERTCWSQDHAEEVFQLRASGMTVEKLAQHFGKTPPTIRKALRLGAVAHPDQKLPRKMPRSCWAKDHASDVMRLKQEGGSTDEIAEMLGKSDTTIRAALKHATDGATAHCHHPAAEADSGAATRDHDDL